MKRRHRHLHWLLGIEMRSSAAIRFAIGICMKEKIAAGGNHTAGLKSDGTVVATGRNNEGEFDVSGWRDIVAVSVDYDHTVGLKSNGTVVATGYNKYGQCNVSGWRNIVAVSAGSFHTVGLKSDGTVVATGDNNEDGECDVSGWTDIGGSLTLR